MPMRAGTVRWQRRQRASTANATGRRSQAPHQVAMRQVAVRRVFAQLLQGLLGLGPAGMGSARAAGDAGCHTATSRLQARTVASPLPFSPIAQHGIALRSKLSVHAAARGAPRRRALRRALGLSFRHRQRTIYCRCIVCSDAMLRGGRIGLRGRGTWLKCALGNVLAMQQIY